MHPLWCASVTPLHPILVRHSFLQADYDTFVDTLPPDNPRYGLFDYEFETQDHCHKSKMVFFSWYDGLGNLFTAYVTFIVCFNKEYNIIKWKLNFFLPSF